MKDTSSELIPWVRDKLIFTSVSAIACGVLSWYMSSPKVVNRPSRGQEIELSYTVTFRKIELIKFTKTEKHLSEQ
jgi:hypothetical protein